MHQIGSFFDLDNKVPPSTFWNANSGRVFMASGLESKGPGFGPRLLKATFDPGLLKNPTQFCQPYL